MNAPEFINAIKKAGGARPYAKQFTKPKSTVQDYYKKARDVIGL
jgi:hypothetical protein